MMYLSKIYMDMTHPLARRDLSNCHSLHQTIMSAFRRSDTPTSARSDKNILYRILPQDGSRSVLYVQSSEEPNVIKWEANGHLRMDFADHHGVKEIPDPVMLFPKGGLLDFDLLASPCKKIGTSLKEERLLGKRQNGKRVILSSPEQRFDWLNRQGEAGGFKVMNAWEAGNVSTNGVKNKDNKINLSGVRFRGTLSVLDQETFAKTFQAGIGPGKAYGYGLLMVSRHRL